MLDGPDGSAMAIADHGTHGGVAHMVPTRRNHALILGQIGSDKGQAGVDVGRVKGQVDLRTAVQTHARAVDLATHRLLRRRFGATVLLEYHPHAP